MVPEHAPRIVWRDGDIPVAAAFDDPYFSLEGGLAETGHVFLAGNGLPGRFQDGFRIAELGFGTGLNALATWKAWDDAGGAGRFYFTSFEAFPMDLADQHRALAAFPVLGNRAARMLAVLATGPGPHVIGPMVLTVIHGDARDTVTRWPGPVDAWFLDGFSPAKNPDLWEPALLQAVSDRLAPGGTLATYTAAGHVRRALAAAGLAVDRRPGYGRKRHMTVARKPD